MVVEQSARGDLAEEVHAPPERRDIFEEHALARGGSLRPHEGRGDRAQGGQACPEGRYRRAGDSRDHREG